MPRSYLAATATADTLRAAIDGLHGLVLLEVRLHLCGRFMTSALGFSGNELSGSRTHLARQHGLRLDGLLDLELDGRHDCG